MRLGLLESLGLDRDVIARRRHIGHDKIAAVRTGDRASYPDIWTSDGDGSVGNVGARNIFDAAENRARCNLGQSCGRGQRKYQQYEARQENNDNSKQAAHDVVSLDLVLNVERFFSL